MDCGPLGLENARIGILSPSVDVATLDILNDMDSTRKHIVKVEEVFTANGKHYLYFAEVPDHMSTLQTLLAEQESQMLDEESIKHVARGLLNLMKAFSGMLKHLHPMRIFINRNNLQEDFKVLCGDSYTFSEVDLHQFEFGNFVMVRNNDEQEMQYLTPEVITKLKSRGLEGNEKRFQKLQDAQLWWDLGILLYRLSCSNNLPF